MCGVVLCCVVLVLHAHSHTQSVLCVCAGVAGVRFVPPEGGAYVFAELSEVLNGKDCFELLDACLDRGVVFAPGSGFGAAYPNHARFCFTAMNPEQMTRGCKNLADALTRFRKQALGFPVLP
jgi:aspartate/methionine/tyrosine aminotransferase